MVATVAVPQAMWRPQLAQHRVVAWDSETYRTVPGRTAPRMVCSQFYDPACRPGPELLHAKGNARQRVWELMLDDSVLLTGHNINYDLAVMAENAGIGGFDVSQDQVLWQIFQLFLRNRIRCTQTREKLILIRDGTLQYAKKGVYNLDGCAKKYLNIDLNKGEGKAMKYWTLHYHLGWDTPIGMWPAAARKYALDDVTSTYGVAMGQQEYVEKIGYTGSAPFSVANEMKQVRTAWVLHLMSCWGIRTDPEAIQKLEERLWKEVEECAVEMRKGGILRDNESKNMSVLKERILRACAAKGVYPVLTPKGELAQQAANDAGQPFKLELEHVATSKKAIKPIEKLDPVLKSVVNFNHAEKLLSNFVEAAKGGIHHPINARFSNPIATGRVSGSAPNLLNLPQGDGIRQCFKARDDHVFSSSDYSVLELRTLAQICHDMGLYSGLREAFIKGRDPHLEFGAKLARTDYNTFLGVFNGDEGPERRKWAKDFRQRAKVLNFGAPGGLGVKRFVDYATAYGLEFSEAEVKLLKNEWMDTWPEMKGYFKWIRNQQDENKWITLHQPRSDRIRGRCTYTQSANSGFQGLAADGATDALWEISYECYLVRSSDLYGSRPLVFPYDEIVAEHPKEHASPAARRLAMLMESVMHERWTPDVPQSVEPVLMNRWDKEAKPVFNDEGFLIAWDSDEED